MAITKATASSIAPAAKGDLVVGSGTNDAAVLAVGTNGYTLVADSAETTGLKFVGQRGCRLVKTSSQSTSTGAWTAITYDTETFDTDGFHSTSTNTSRITIPTGLDGYYFIWANMTWAVNGNGQRGGRIQQDGSQDRWKLFMIPSAGYGIGMTIADVYYLSAGAYIEFQAYQDSGGNLNVDGAIANGGLGVAGAVWLGA